MSKAVLVVDMPVNCHECELSGKDMEGVYCLVRNDKDYVKKYKGIPSWCPLKPLPAKRNTPRKAGIPITRYYRDKGYDDCIDEITGETE